MLEPIATTLEGMVASLGDDVLLMLDPNARPAVIPDAEAWRARIGRLLARVDIVKVSVEDLAFLRPGEELGGGGRAGSRRPVRGWSWSRMAGGRSRWSPGASAERVEAPPVELVDTVGAGDTFGGAFLACLVHDGVGARRRWATRRRSCARRGSRSGPPPACAAGPAPTRRRSRSSGAGPLTPDHAPPSSKSPVTFSID